MVTGNAAVMATKEAGGAMVSTVSTEGASQSRDVDNMAAKFPGEAASEVAANVNLTGDCTDNEKISSPTMKESERLIDPATVDNVTTVLVSLEATMGTSSETNFDTNNNNEGTTAGMDKLDVNHIHRRVCSNSNASKNTAQSLNASDDKTATESTNETGMAMVKPSGTDSKPDSTPISRPEQQQQQQPPLLPNVKPKLNAPAQQIIAPLPTTTTTSVPQAAATYTSNHMMDFEDEYSDINDTLLTMSFNQDGGCLAIGTGSGFRICNVHPYQETFRRNLGGAGGSNAIEGGKSCRYYYHATKILLRVMFRCLIVAYCFMPSSHLLFFVDPPYLSRNCSH
jgi:hypothetical protein